jgi:hypothetical protein
VTGTLDGGPQAAHGPLRRNLQRWLAKARQARVGYLAQDAPVYAGLSVADHWGGVPLPPRAVLACNGLIPTMRWRQAR